MNTRFSKYQALGNDYIVLDPRTGAALPSPAEARRICDRKRGLGSDGILFGPVAAAGGPGAVIIINPDGSRAEKSGNGARIFARYLRDSGTERGGRFRFLTAGGQVEAELLDPAGDTIRLDMGAPRFPRGVEPFELAAAGGSFRALAVDMGNPHCVILAVGRDASRAAAVRLARGVDDTPTELHVSADLCALADLRALAERYGAAIEAHPFFPARTNVQFARIAAAGSRAADRAVQEDGEDPPSGASAGTVIHAAVWERGAGMTEASGSSACAVAAAFRALGAVDEAVRVRMPGGELLVEFAPGGSVLLTGPVRRVAGGELDPSFFEGGDE